MIYSWTLTNATITAEWMHRFIKPSTILVTPLTTTSWKKAYYDTAPRLLIRYSQRFKQTRLAVFRWTVTFCNLQSMWNLSKEKEKKRKRNSSSPIKKRNLSAGNFCHQTSALSYLNTQNTEGRKGGSVFAVEGILKSSEESKTRKNPEQTKRKPHRAKQRSMKHQEG